MTAHVSHESPLFLHADRTSLVRRVAAFAVVPNRTEPNRTQPNPELTSDVTKSARAHHRTRARAVMRSLAPGRALTHQRARVHTRARRMDAVVRAFFGGGAPKNTKSAHGFTVKTIDGESVELSKYAGKVCLVVNVASQ